MHLCRLEYSWLEWLNWFLIKDSPFLILVLLYHILYLLRKICNNSNSKTHMIFAYLSYKCPHVFCHLTLWSQCLLFPLCPATEMFSFKSDPKDRLPLQHIKDVIHSCKCLIFPLHLKSLSFRECCNMLMISCLDVSKGNDVLAIYYCPRNACLGALSFWWGCKMWLSSTGMSGSSHPLLSSHTLTFIRKYSTWAIQKEMTDISSSGSMSGWQQDKKCRIHCTIDLPLSFCDLGVSYHTVQWNLPQLRSCKAFPLELLSPKSLFAM